MAEPKTATLSDTPIRVMLGHRSPLLRGALAALLSRQDGLKVVAELSRSDDLLAIASRVEPDVTVVEYLLPGHLTMLDICRALGQRTGNYRILILVDHHSGSIASIGRSLTTFVPQVGLLATEASPDAFVDGVRRMARGEPVLDPKLAMAALRGSEPLLTDRECEVLRHAMGGATVKEIAKSLCLSTGTVRNYLSRTLSKTGARTRIEAVRIAVDAGWI